MLGLDSPYNEMLLHGNRHLFRLGYDHLPCFLPVGDVQSPEALPAWST